MATVLYYGKDKAEGLKDEDIDAYISNEETEKVAGVLNGLIDVLVTDSLATKLEDKGDFYVKSTSNDNYVGFILNYNAKTKKLFDITIDNNGEQNMAVGIDDIDGLLTNEEYMFPIFDTLDVR